MWINLSREEIHLICSGLAAGSEFASKVKIETSKALSERLITDMKARFDPNNQQWVDLAFEQFHQDGEIEIDRQADGSALVSESEDGGAYVMAWVYVEPENQS